MKKTLAIILSVVMLFGVLTINTFAVDTEPKVTLITNEGSPVNKNIDTYFTVRLDNFSSIKGIDITISADSGLSFKGVDSTGLTNELEKGTNYTITDNKIRIVDLTTDVQTAKIIILACATTDEKATQNITVEGKYADSGKTLFNITTEPGVFEVNTTIEPTDIDTASGEVTLSYDEVTTAGNFIPYGSVYKAVGNSFVFAPKSTEGDFVVSESGYQYDTYKIPDNGITTYGVSYNTNTNDLRFGSYSNKNTTGVKHGTMVFEGDWLALKEYYIKKGYTVEEIIDAIYKNYDIKNPEGQYKYVRYTVSDKNGVSKQVNVYKFEQNNYMWKGQNEDANILEYAIRLVDYIPATNYTAIAYSINGEDVTLSDNVKSITTASATE